jgi:hypothetical protein
MVRRDLFAVAVLALSAAAPSAAQDPPIVVPFVPPDGPPGELPPPVHDLNAPATLRPAPLWHPSPPPAAFAGSACNFDAWEGDNIFSPDFRSYQVLLGAYASSGLGPDVPSFNYIPLTLRKGWMLTAPDHHHPYLGGNWECLVDLMIAPIISDVGNYFVGPSFLLRRNLLDFGESVVPYAQIGGGFVLTDAHRDKTHEVFGQAFNFLCQAQIGLRCFISSDLSIDIEGGVQHISNANYSSRNYGINAFGGQIGVTYHFPWGAR